MIQSRFYGKIDTHNLKECYESEIELNGKQIRIDMWFEEKTITENSVTEADNFLMELAKFHRLSKKKIEKDFQSGQEVKEYLENHLEEFDESEQLELGINPKDHLSKKIEALYQKLYLKRVGIYPTNAFGGEFAIFDFTINQEMTDYLIVVKMNKYGQISELTIES